MSAVKVWTISFVGNNPLGGYVSGDIVDIYYDPSLDPSPGVDLHAGMSVNLNGAPVTSGNDIDFITNTYHTVIYKTVQSYNNIICNNGFFVSFSPVQSSFPYGLNIYYEDHATCSINPSVCDLSFTADITVNYPSSISATDGSITAMATSSNTIKYKLGSDFDYNDGTGSTSPIFSSLAQGSYRIYARDSINCGASILVSLPYNDTYSVKYSINYINLAGHRSKIDILQRAYGGTSSDIVLGGDSGSPFFLDLRGESVLDKFQPILATQATVNLISQTDGQFQELYTNDSKQYRINFYKDVSGGTSYSLHWSGFIVPQIYSEQYIMPPYNATVQASDGLPNLGKLAFLLDDGNKYFGTVRVMTLISNALQKTNLQLNIRSGVNLFASTMAATSSDDPLDQSYVDVDTYYLGFSNTPTWADVLNCILKAFRARLVQANGVWNIIRPEECVSSFAYREFDASGNYVSNSTYDLSTIVASASSSNRLRWRDEDQNLELRPGYGKLRIRYHLGYKDNILRNGDFSLITQYNSLVGAYQYQLNLFGFQVISQSYAMSYSYSLNTPSDLTDVSLILSAPKDQMVKPFGYVQSDNYMMAMGASNTIKITLDVACPVPFTQGLSVDGSGNFVFYTKPLSVPYQKIRMNVYYGGKYLQTDGSWTNIPTDIIFYCTQFGQFVKFDITASWPDPTYSTAKQFYVKVYHSSENDYDFSDVATMRNKITNSNTGTHSARGNYDASTGVFPSTGGSGGGGAIVAGDRWTANVMGSIYGVVVAVSTPITCINSSPGQDSANWLIGELVLPVGTRTELHNVSYGSGILYYELKNTTDPESVPNIIRPNDYNSGTNPNQWVLVTSGGDLSARSNVDFYINKIQVQYLDNGASPFDAIVREISGESNNLLAVEDDIFHGSLESYMSSITANVIVTNLKFGTPNPYVVSNPFDLSLNNQFPSNKTIFPNSLDVPITQSILSGDLIYSGFFRDSSGTGYTNWTRNGISESDHLYSIWLKTTIAQYNRTWKKITGSLYGDVFSPLINIIEDLDGVKYIPISLNYDDKNNTYNGEFLELMDITVDSGSDGTGTSPFNSAYSNGFGNAFH